MPINPRAVGATLLLASLSTGTADAADWTMAGDVAQTIAVETSDGNDARLEVRCTPKPRVLLRHPSLDSLEAETSDRRPNWYGTVRVRSGWGLNLERPEHQGATTYWWRCEGARRCLAARDTGWIIRELKRNWTWHLRAEPADRPHVDMRFSLEGSRQAIEAACPRSGDARGDGGGAPSRRRADTVGPDRDTR